MALDKFIVYGEQYKAIREQIGESFLKGNSGDLGKFLKVMFLESIYHTFVLLAVIDDYSKMTIIMFLTRSLRLISTIKDCSTSLKCKSSINIQCILVKFPSFYSNLLLKMHPTDDFGKVNTNNSP